MESKNRILGAKNGGGCLLANEVLRVYDEVIVYD